MVEERQENQFISILDDENWDTEEHLGGQALTEEMTLDQGGRRVAV